MTSAKALTADWILPVTSPPIAQGAILIDRDKIVYVGPQSKMPPCDAVVHHRQAAILPGLINAHTHLEFSDLEAPLGRPGIEFTQWIKEVVAWRTNNAIDKKAAIQLGLSLSVQSGVVAIGEIASPPFDADHYTGPELDSKACKLHVFLETLGADETEYADKIAQLENLVRPFKKVSIAPAISPHAPYSVPLILLDRLIALTVPAQGLNAVTPNFSSVAMHVAETIAEREFVEHRRGPFVDLLKTFGVWRPQMFAQNGAIIDVLKSLARAPRALVIHGNYLEPSELDFIAMANDRMSLVFCPRTHRYFRHTAYPIQAIIERGINLAVGTDSLASNPDLNVLQELREIARTYPQIADETIIEMGTINGARALGIDDHYGSLEKGKAGGIGTVELPDKSDPYSWLR